MSQTHFLSDRVVSTGRITINDFYYAALSQSRTYTSIKKKNEQTNQCSHSKQIKTIPSFKCTENLAYVCQIKNRQVFLTLSFPDGVLFSIINFLHIYLDKVKLWTYLFLHQKSSLFSKQMSAIWALAWEEKKTKQTTAFCILTWKMKHNVLYWNVPQNVHNFSHLGCTELKKAPEGTRHIMSNQTRQCLTTLKICNFPNLWELKLTG